MMSACRSHPCVFMAEEGTSTQAVMQMVELGAVDVLQKPLTRERLQNIWQHVVRKVRQRLKLAPSPLNSSCCCCLLVQRCTRHSLLYQALAHSS